MVGSFDWAAHLFQRCAREVVLGSAVILVPVMVLRLWLTVLVFDHFESFDGAVVAIPGLTGGAGTSGIETLVSYVGLLVSSLAVALVGGYLTHVVLQQQFGSGPSMGRALRATSRRLPALVAAWLIGHCWLLPLGWVAVHIDTVDLLQWVVVIVPAGLVLVSFTTLVSPVLVAERLRPWAAVRRGAGLARSRFAAVMGFNLLSLTVVQGVQAGITYLPRLADLTGLVPFGRSGWLVEGVAAQLALLLSLPLAGVATAAFYLQVRVHSEAMDITMAADRAFGGR